MSPEHSFEEQSKNSEKTELTPVEITRQKIKEYIEDAEVESARFQAFADFVDWQEATVWGPRKKATIAEVIKLSLIEETIRQRQNGVMGYKREFNQATGLYLDLYASLYKINNKEINTTALRERDFRISNGNLPEEIRDMVLIKNRAVERKVNNH